MNSVRIAFAAAALFALVRFFVTPTWPCAVVALGAVIIAAWANKFREESIREVRWSVEEEKRARETGEKAILDVTKEVVAVMRKDLDETRAKVDTLASRRAFGG